MPRQKEVELGAAIRSVHGQFAPLDVLARIAEDAFIDSRDRPSEEDALWP
jgi:hypothetical protein